MDFERVFKLAEPYLKKNYFGVAHTRRVFDIAKNNFEIPEDKEDLIYCSIILHDVGGSSIKDQYEKGPKIATAILKKLDYDERFVHEVCEIMRTHHEHPEQLSKAFQILYDSDRLVMFSPEEFPYYNSIPDFDWKKSLIQSIQIRQKI
jgi:HD superfamily phosphodiesterase